MIEALNTECFCVSLDREALRQAIDDDPAARGLSALIEERCPHLFAALPVYVSRRHVDEMAKIIAAVEEVIALPSYRKEVLSYAPAIAHVDPGARGVFVGYDFHLGAAGPKLIEINSNAGGALLNGVLGRAQRACCEDVASLVSGPVPAERLDRTIFEMFIEEWRLAGRGGAPARVAIVDDRPEEQFLYPEFLLFERLFRRFGVRAFVLAPEQLTFHDGKLRDANGPIDLVYNRLTDFSLQEAAHAALRAAYLAGAAVVTPHPRAHALYADKRNLAVLSDESRLAALGVRREAIETCAPPAAVLLRYSPRMPDFLQEKSMAKVDIKTVVKERYAQAALNVSSGTKTSCCRQSECCDPITSNLYDAAQTGELPEAAVLASLGCGNPTALAELKPGEVVLDLGSGGGIDVLLSAKRVGPTGKAYGLDMTDEMLALAEENKRKAGAQNVEFLKGDIENIPLPDNSVDVIISNCVINLAADKDAVLREAFRVLKPGGRFAVSDVVTKGAVPAEIRNSMLLWVGCVAGALEESEYRAKLAAAGFQDIDIEPTRVYRAEDAKGFLADKGMDASLIGPQVDGKFMSAFIRGTKPPS